jgi:DNA-binding transcriptional LysR family regulator
MRLFTVASPTLISERGAPADIDALSSLPVTASLDPNTGRPWPWYFTSGRQWTPAHPAVVADDADLEMGAVLEGLAFGQLADFMAAPYIACGELVRVLREEEPEPWGLYVYRPQRGPVAPRVRVVFDAIVDAVSTLAASLPELDASAGRTRKRRT